MNFPVKIIEFGILVVTVKLHTHLQQYNSINDLFVALYFVVFCIAFVFCLSILVANFEIHIFHYGLTIQFWP